MKMNKMIDMKDNYLGLRTSDGAGLYLTALVFLYVAQVMVLLVASLARISDENIYLGYAVMAINQVVFFACPMLYGKIFAREMIKPSRIASKITNKQWLLLPLIAGAAFLIGLPLSEAFTGLLLKLGYTYKVSLPVATMEQWWTLPLSLLFVAVLPAIGEEFLFRGSIGRALKAKSYCFSMICTSLLFAFFHGNALQLVHQFLLGLVMSYCYFVTGSLIAPIVIHFVNNAVSIIVIFIQSGVGDLTMPLGIRIPVYIAMVITGIFVLLLLLRTITRESKKAAGIEISKISAKGYFTDLGRAFYPKGIVQNYRNLNASMKLLYNDSIDQCVTVEDYKALLSKLEGNQNNSKIDLATIERAKNAIDELESNDKEKYADVKDDSIRRQLINADKQMTDKRKRMDRNALCFAFGAAIAILLINIIVGFKGAV